MEYLHLEVTNSITNNKSKRITSLSEDGIIKPIEIFHEFDRIIPWSENTLIDGHVFAVLLYALSRDKPLKIHGTVSRSALRNIEELQLVWCRWKPSIYKKIEIIPDKIYDTLKLSAEEKAISAFSGGMDSTFTALRHTKILPEKTRYPLRSALMVHGFDVDLYNHSDFEKLAKRVTPLLNDLNLDLRTIRTNSRELKFQDWEDTHGLELAACLHMYNEEFRFGLIGSSHSYDSLKFPWGSTPVTDPLISNHGFSIIYDGAGFSRNDKASIIKDFPIACQTLKVCWSGSDQSGNCGKCEKCVRTQLNFLAAGVTTPLPCFPHELDIQNINSINIEGPSKLKALKSISTYAKKNNIQGEWLKLLDARIATWQQPDVSVLTKRKKGGIIKRFIINILTCLGLSEPAKKIWRKIRRNLQKNT